jgi:hypothetical protein
MTIEIKNPRRGNGAGTKRVYEPSRYHSKPDPLVQWFGLGKEAAAKRGWNRRNGGRR